MRAIAVLLALLPAAAAVAAGPTPEACGCATAFDEVVALTETNYAGYVIKLPDEAARRVYERFRGLLRADAAGASSEACRDLLAAYTGFFADHHLFAFPRRGVEPHLPELAAWTEASARSHFAGQAHPHDLLEGLWYDAVGRLAIVPDPALASGTLAAVRLDGERRGEIAALFVPSGAGWLADFRTDDFGWQRAEAHLHRDGDLLVFGLKGFGRVGAPHLDPSHPLAPRFEILDPGMVYLSMPSFMPEHDAALKAIVAAHRDDLAGAKALIMDVRGNAGGDAIYFPLADFFLANDIRIADDSKVLASPRTIAHFEGLRERMGDHGSWLDAPLARMRAHPGQIVEYRAGSTDGLAAYPENPKRVVVLQDRGVGSAAEAFVYHVRQSANVTTMGEPTRGNIDYMQVSMHEAGCGDFAVWFGYPLYFDASLPEGSIDDEGYAPDVRLPSGTDWLAFARRWMAED